MRYKWVVPQGSTVIVAVRTQAIARWLDIHRLSRNDSKYAATYALPYSIRYVLSREIPPATGASVADRNDTVDNFCKRCLPASVFDEVADMTQHAPLPGRFCAINESIYTHVSFAEGPTVSPLVVDGRVGNSVGKIGQKPNDFRKDAVSLDAGWKMHGNRMRRVGQQVFSKHLVQFIQWQNPGPRRKHQPKRRLLKFGP